MKQRGPSLRGDRRGQPLTKQEHDFLYERAIEGSQKDAARVTESKPRAAHYRMAQIFEKLGVEDITSAFWAMGWLHPLPYGVSAAEVRHEKLSEGNHTEGDFWGRMDAATKRQAKIDDLG